MSIQVNDTLADCFRGYAKLLRQIKQRVLLAQQRAIYAANEEMLRMYWDIGGICNKARMPMVGARKLCSGWRWI